MTGSRTHDVGATGAINGRSLIDTDSLISETPANANHIRDTKCTEFPGEVVALHWGLSRITETYTPTVIQRLEQFTHPEARDAAPITHTGLQGTTHGTYLLTALLANSVYPNMQDLITPTTPTSTLEADAETTTSSLHTAQTTKTNTNPTSTSKNMTTPAA